MLVPTDVVPSHYALELSPNLDLLTFSCAEQITVNVVKQCSSITLHSKEISIVTASFTSAADGAKVAVSKISYDLVLHTVRLDFGDKPMALGQGKVEISFSGILNGDMAGFYKSTYTDASGNKQIMASTQFEALDARRAFPCVDEPSVKCTFAVTMIVAEHLRAISNMPEIACQYLPNGKKKVVFDVTPKMSTYLLAWAVGVFDMVRAVSKNNVEIRIFSPPGRAEQGRFALDCGVRALDFYDDFFGIPYPLPKLDMLCVTEFAMGAMENWGLVTYREVALMIDDEKASPQAKQRVAIVVAHELAHQWFGNLVTMAWWDGLWLNEGFAAWMEHFCIDALYPEYEIWSQFTTDAFGAAQRLDSLKTSHPIIVPIKHAEEVEQVFDAISYCKGSCVVNMVYTVLGYDQFRRGLQIYFKKFAYGNTETEDLWAAWSEASGLDVSALMRTWTMNMGYPYLKVVEEKWGATDLVVTLEQDWFLADGSKTPDAPLWSVPLLFATPSGTSDKAQIMTQKRQEFTIALKGAGDWVKINTSQAALARVLHTTQMNDRLKAGLQSGTVSPVDRAAILLDTYALVKAGLAQPESVIEVLRSLENETSSIVWGAMQSVLSGMYLLLEQISSAVTDAFRAFGAKLVLSALAKVGWDPKAQEGHTDKLLRATILALLDTFACNDPAVVAEARRRFAGHFDDPAMLPSDYKTTVYKIVLQAGGAEEYEKILKTYYATEDNQERKYALFSLGCTNDVALKQRTLDWGVSSGDVKLQDCCKFLSLSFSSMSSAHSTIQHIPLLHPHLSPTLVYPVSAVASSAAGIAMAWEYYKTNFEKVSRAVTWPHRSWVWTSSTRVGRR